VYAGIFLPRKKPALEKKPSAINKQVFTLKKIKKSEILRDYAKKI
jgi:hypothetical protein